MYLNYLHNNAVVLIQCGDLHCTEYTVQCTMHSKYKNLIRHRHLLCVLLHM